MDQKQIWSLFHSKDMYFIKQYKVFKIHLEQERKFLSRSKIFILFSLKEILKFEKMKVGKRKKNQ